VRPEIIATNSVISVRAQAAVMKPFRKKDDSRMSLRSRIMTENHALEPALRVENCHWWSDCDSEVGKGPDQMIDEIDTSCRERKGIKITWWPTRTHPRSTTSKSRTRKRQIEMWASPWKVSWRWNFEGSTCLQELDCSCFSWSRSNHTRVDDGRMMQILIMLWWNLLDRAFTMSLVKGWDVHSKLRFHVNLEHT
jgi:hypothetical protein